jgi:hypothetical protein
MGETKLKSPTCRDCAMRSGRVPVDSVHAVYEDDCGNCGQKAAVSSASDWRLRSERHHPLDWD